jgi:hypothetical protein
MASTDRQGTDNFSGDTLGGPDGTVWTGLTIFGAVTAFVAVALPVAVWSGWTLSQYLAPVMPS